MFEERYDVSASSVLPADEQVVRNTLMAIRTAGTGVLALSWMYCHAGDLAILNTYFYQWCSMLTWFDAVVESSPQTM